MTQEKLSKFLRYTVIKLQLVSERYDRTLSHLQRQLRYPLNGLESL